MVLYTFKQRCCVSFSPYKYNSVIDEWLQREWALLLFMIESKKMHAL